VKLIGLLSWFDEPVSSLVTCLRALAHAGTDHVVALDGRYALYPADHDVSHPNEYAAILLACRELGMGCTIHQPAGPFEGGEVEKRTMLFELGWTVAEAGDWFWVQDADQWTTSVPGDLKDRLAATDLDAAEVDMLDVEALRANVANWPAHFAMRSLFRAQPIRVEGNHVNYVTADGRHLWGRDGDGRVENALDLASCVHVEHHPQERDNARLHAKLVYYGERDAAGVERGSCELCGVAAVSLEPVRWRITEIGPVADWMECCGEHAEAVSAVNDVELRKLGIDPASVVAGSLNGRAPDALSGAAADVALRRHAAV
jgi:hypothetical protein